MPTPTTPFSNGGSDHPGAARGLPARGRGSLASLLRRGGAALVDLAVSQLIVVTVLDIDVTAGGSAAFAPLGLFALMHLLLVGTIGRTIGHAVVGVEVRALDGGPLRPRQTLMRTLMVLLFLPAVFTADDGRGFHDKAAGAMTLRSR